MVNNLVQLPTFVPGSAEWADQRRLSVGGSEIAPLLGLGKWESRFSLWHRKQGLLEPQGDNPEMEWGRLLEPVIIAKYAAAHPEITVTRGQTYTRSDRPWQIASPDAEQEWPDGLSRPIEVKTARDDLGWGEPGTDEIPVYYRAQVIWYLDVLGQDWCDVAVLIAGSDYREYRVQYDAAEAALMRAEAEAFIETLNTGERPRIDEHSATYQAVKELHPDIEPIDVELPADLAKSYCTARQAAKAAKAEEQRQTSLVADVLGNGRRATFLGDTIATRQARGNGTPYLVAGRNLPNFDPKAA